MGGGGESEPQSMKFTPRTGTDCKPKLIDLAAESKCAPHKLKTGCTKLDEVVPCCEAASLPLWSRGVTSGALAQAYVIGKCCAT